MKKLNIKLMSIITVLLFTAVSPMMLTVHAADSEPTVEVTEKIQIKEIDETGEKTVKEIVIVYQGGREETSTTDKILLVASGITTVIGIIVLLYGLVQLLTEPFDYYY